MKKSNSHVDNATRPDQVDKSTSDIEAEQEEKEKYQSEPEGKVKLSDYLRIFSYGTKRDFVLLFIGSLSSIGTGVTLPLVNVVFGNLVGNFNSYLAPDRTILQGDFTSMVNKNTLFFVYLFIARAALSYVSMYSFRIAGLRLSAAIRLAYLRALFSQSISSLDKLPSGQSAGMITASANLLQIGISERLSIFLQFTSLFISAYIIAFKYSWQLTLVASSVVLFVLLVFGIIVPISVKLQKSVDHANEKASSIASEVFGSIRMVVACGAEKRVVNTYSKWIDEARRRGLKLSPVIGIQFAPVFFAIYADMALTFWFGVKLYDEYLLDSVGTVLIVLTSVMISVFSLSNIVAPLNAAIKAAGAAASFFAMIDAPSVEKDGLKAPDVSAEKDISFKGVTFAYPSRPRVKVLDDLDLCFEAGKLTAIVGPSGSGKSTIVGLMERWYELTAESETNREPVSGGDEKTIDEQGPVDDKKVITLSGTIRIGDRDLRDLDLKWWRSQIGLVQQEPFIFNDTIYKNVAYGLVGSKFENESDEMKRHRVQEACKEAFADEFISRLPVGYDTKVGDSGIKLSGGQRQRLAIARSIIKRPMILIFDEATSAIDVRGERIVQDALDRVAKNRTTITIAHRLSTIKKADNIVVVAKGKVVEQGTHEELLRKDDGVYSNLVHAQKLTMDAHVEELLKVPSSDLATEDIAVEEKSPKIQVKETPYKLRGFLRSFGLLLIEQNAHLPWLILTIAAAIGSATSFPLQSYILAHLVAVFQESRGQPILDDSAHWAFMFFILALCIGTTYLIVGWAASTLSTYVACAYRLEYFDSITKKPIEFYDADENSSGTLTSRVANDPTQLQEMMGVNMSMVLIALFSIIGCLAISFSFGWKLTLVSAAPALPLIIFASFYRVRFELQFEKLNALVFEESSQFAAEAFGAFRTVTALTLEDMICDRYAALLQEQVDKARRKARFKTLVFALSDSIIFPCIALTFWYGGQLLATFEYDIVKYLIVYMAIINGSESAGTWCSFGPNMAQASAAANRILSLRDWSKTLKNISKVSLRGSDSGGGAEITFLDVHFKYPTRDTPVFNGLSMTIKKGQFAGLVGASGCGKTTIISLLEQFYQVDQGTVNLDGVNIKDINIKEYRKAISLVAQEPTLFQGTIRENILLAVDEGSTTEEDLHQACRDAEIHDFITSLPEGYGTDIGSKGVALSGGQKQRIAIARALIRKPRILLLDEATSSLDSESEKLVQAAFERAGKGRTMVVVAHRLATVQNADVIFVLGNAGNGSRVLEKGSHAELVARRGVYYQMCQSQALDR